MQDRQDACVASALMRAGFCIIVVRVDRLGDAGDPPHVPSVRTSADFHSRTCTTCIKISILHNDDTSNGHSRQPKRQQVPLQVKLLAVPTPRFRQDPLHYDARVPLFRFLSLLFAAHPYGLFLSLYL